MSLNFDGLVRWLEIVGDLEIEPRATSAGRGLFAAVAIAPSKPLFTIPARALLNCRTLSPHYPPGLDAIQLIALHLCLYRPLDSFPSSDPLFGPYVSSLPREFDSHPLADHVQHRERNLPPSVATALARLHDRYLHDWCTVRGYLVPLAHHSDNNPVNTRCIYHRLKGTRSHPDNLTLCPILDFANHTVTSPCMTPRLSNAERANAPPIPRLGDPLTLLSPATSTKPNEELYLTYGAHSNRTLFIEYGFVVPCAPDDPRAEVDVQDIVEPLFENREDEGAVKKKMLEDSGYWGDWTLDGSPAVSYRLITALRLLHAPLSDSDGALQRWRDTLTGIRDTVSDANESAWRKTVAEICAILIQRAEARRTEKNLAAVEILWEEELNVARRVAGFEKQ
ncbi:hypothetical protein B0H19DRAFT_954756 [Mycena capillaripes]|nr:hypothetical protein B0H19DRAFT_954756 [Mycena capillaripes]